MKSGIAVARAAALLLLAATALLATVPLSSQERRPSRGVRTVMVHGREAADGEVLVRYRPEASGTIHRQRAEFQTDADEVEVVGRRGTRRMRSRRLGTSEMLETLRANPDIEFAEPNYVLNVGTQDDQFSPVSTRPGDESFGYLWGLFNDGRAINGIAGTAGADISATLAWDITTGSRANVVGVVDTGIDYHHPDLAANIWSAPRAFSVTIGGGVITCAAGTHGFNAITNTCNPMDDHSHGTHVAGTIGAVGNNGIGITGVNWVASMMALKFLSSSGSGVTSDAIKAIEFAIQAKNALGADANVRVLSNSWGGGGYSQSLKDEIDAANAADMLFVAAAGNNAANNDLVRHYPSSYTSVNVISVAATTNRDQRASFSNWGATSVDLGAPGQAILSTIPNNQYAWYNGTSMATPHVSGAAALILAVCPLTTAQLKTAILAGVDVISSLSGITTTGGRLDANAAVRSCSPARLTVNGSSTGARVAPGSTLTVEITDGPGHAGDLVMLTPQGAAATHWSGVYQYLNGTTTRPASGRTSATLSFAAPSSAGGYEFRFFENDTWKRLATSGPVTVENPVPTLTSLSPTTIVGGSSPVTVTLTGTNFTTSSSIRVNDLARSTTYVSPTQLQTVVTASERATPATLGFRVINPLPGGGTSTNRNLVITAAPTITINGSTAAATVGTGSTISVGISGGPGNRGDFIMMVPAGAAATYWSGIYQYLNGSTTPAASGSTGATLFFTAPSSSGSFEFRFFENDTWALLSTSATMTVAPPNPAPVITALSPSRVRSGTAAFSLTVTGSGFVQGSQVRVNDSARTTTYVSASQLTVAIPASDVTSAGARNISVFNPIPGGGTSGNLTLEVTTPPSITVNGSGGAVSVAGTSALAIAIANGPGAPGDFVMLVPSGAADTYWSGNYQYLNGTTTRPASGSTSATLTFSAPVGGGVFEARFFANDTWTRLATSAPITVTAWSPPAPTVKINGSTGSVSVAPGATFTVGIENGPANRGDFVMLVPQGSADTYWSGIYQYLNGSTTAPASGVSSATLTFTAPTADGNYEVRFFKNDTWTRLATSRTITVSGPVPQLRVNGQATPITVAGGGAVMVDVTNGPATRGDFVMLVPAGSVDTYWSGIYQYLDGSTTTPSSGLSNATLTFAAPAAGGSFEFRFFENDTWKRLATSSIISVLPASSAPRVSVNGSLGPVSAASGSTLTVRITNGPGNRGDFVMLVPYGSVATYWSGVYQYLDGGSTTPSSGQSSATLSFTAPASGSYEVRFFANDTWSRLATSGTLTVTP